jgi:hypothetical protein
MAFNAGAFIGGFSEAVSARIQESNKEAARIREEERLEQRMIDKEARAAARADEADRRKQERELELLTGQLALYYSPEQTTNILKSGKAGATFALNKAEGYSAEDLDPRTMYEVQDYELERSEVSPVATSLRTEAKAGPAVRQGEAIPFAEKFKPLPKTLTTKAKTFEARLVELDFAMSQAKDADEKEALEGMYTNTHEKYLEFKKKNDLGGDYFSKQSLDSIVNNAVKSKFRGKDFVELTPEGLIKSFQTGNEGDVAALYLDSYLALEARRQAEPWKDDAGAKTAINEVLKEYTKYKATLVNRAETKYITEIAELNTGDADEQVLAAELKVNGTNNFKPHTKSDGTPRTVDDVRLEKQRFDANTVIQYVHDGRVYSAVKTTFGNLLWGHQG